MNNNGVNHCDTVRADNTGAWWLGWPLVPCNTGGNVSNITQQLSTLIPACAHRPSDVMMAGMMSVDRDGHPDSFHDDLRKR
jgi:hypothetical protein